MFGGILRAAPDALFVTLIAAITSYVLAPLYSFAVASDGASETDILLWGLRTASANFLLVGLFAGLLTLLARANLESGPGGI